MGDEPKARGGSTPTRPEVALITGGGSGIGLALGRLLNSRGVRVILADVDEGALARAARDDGLEGVRLDVTDAAAVKAAVEGAAERLGALDYLFNNAGVGGSKDLREATLEQWRRIVELNLMGVVHGVSAAYPLMIRQGRGHIVNTASISGLIPWPGQTLYNTTKYAVVGLSHSLRLEAARFGVRVSVVCPAAVQSAIWGVSILGERDPTAAPPEGAVPAETAAEIIWRGVRANRETIVLPRFAAVWAGLYRVHPGLLRGVFARQLRRLPP